MFHEYFPHDPFAGWRTMSGSCGLSGGAVTATNDRKRYGDCSGAWHRATLRTLNERMIPFFLSSSPVAMWTWSAKPRSMAESSRTVRGDAPIENVRMIGFIAYCLRAIILNWQ
ncbi:hypothetical protein AB9N12_17660 [Bacteroides sp. AN502(2024)]|uniref:hypothetical protein n=1 Tax=Bacteroides sp. AN502(2024) TaxID=3160599 RepID=UPI0035197422